MSFGFHIGMRKIKSLFALSFTFLIWQLIRIFFPELEVHPLFAYIYSVVEMRESVDKAKNFAKLRIKATFVGLTFGLIFITISSFIVPKISSDILKTLAELIFILLATLCSLCLAEVVKCKNFCGIAAIITVICIVSHNEEDIYLYAIMRVVQTLIGIFSAMVINVLIKYKNNDETQQQSEQEQIQEEPQEQDCAIKEN